MDNPPCITLNDRYTKDPQGNTDLRTDYGKWRLVQGLLKTVAWTGEDRECELWIVIEEDDGAAVPLGKYLQRIAVLLPPID